MMMMMMMTMKLMIGKIKTRKLNYLDPEQEVHDPYLSESL
jgi:hypothetical protein